MLKWLLLLLVTFPLKAQETRPTMTVIAPIRYLGIDYTQRSEIKREARDAWDSLVVRSLGAPSSFVKALSGPTLSGMSLNLRNEVSLYAGRSTPNDLLVEPILCRLGSQWVAAIVESHPMTTEIYQIKSRLLAFNQEETSQALKDFMATRPFADLYSGTTERKAPKSALKISLSLAAKNTRLDQGSGHCANLLLQQALLLEYRITKSIGLHTNFTLRRVFKSNDPTDRSTRNMALKWQFPSPNFQLPVEMNATYRWSDSVFGTAIYDEPKSLSANLTLNGFELVEGFGKAKQDFDQAKTELIMDESPMISKIYRAWVYLDKGRAWGLKMNDRVLFNGDPKLAGHVVGFFGPKMKIRSPRGYAVNEGAIIFVRDGQKEVKIGDSISYDPKVYP